MLNATYKILHIDLGNEERNHCAYQIDSVLSSKYQPLDVDTVYLKTFSDIESFSDKFPLFRVNPRQPMVEGDKPFPPTSGLVGIWASNYLAYKKFLETDKEVLFMFEDDAFVSRNFPYVVEKHLKELPEDWDVFTIYVPWDCIGWYNPDYDIPGKEAICRTYQDWSCASYAISRQGAEKVIADIEKNGISDPIDWYLFNAGFHGTKEVYFNTYSVKPSVYRPVWLAPIAAVSSVPETTELA